MGRGVIIDGQPWFVAADACRCLDMDVTSGTAQWLRPLAQNERSLVKRQELPEIFSGSFAPTLTLVSRPGLFKLIQRSSKPEAKAFDHWVRHEVLPQIMDNGGYISADAGVDKVAGAATNRWRTDLDLMETVVFAMTAMQERIDVRGAQM